jgi:uncharacterized hydrophobic protein (TIGR00271 family)
LKKYKNYFLVVKDDQEKALVELQEFFKNHYKHSLTIVNILELNVLESDTLYFLYLDDDSIKEFLYNYKDQKINISILPHSQSSKAMERFGISKDIYEAFDDSFNQELRVDDQLLLCNEHVVFNKISIGNVQNFNQHNNNFLKNFTIFINNLKKLKYQAVNLTTAKEKNIQTVVSGVLVLEDYTNINSLSNIENSSFHDGKLNAFIISPSSLLSFLYHFFIILFYHKFSLTKLPKGIGFVSTQKLSISSNSSFEFTIDKVGLSAKSVEIEVYQSALNIGYGKSFQSVIDEKNTIDDKESFNVRSLPKGEMRDLLVQGKIPLLKKASDEDMKETLTSIKEGSQTTSIFITLMILSTLLATVGIFQDSTPSVIGAMILAPLMTPIVSMSMGTVRSDNFIIKKSAKTLFVGVGSALFFSAIVTSIIPLDNTMTSQIYNRINPNLLDLSVAIFSGIAGAYAASKEEVAKSLAGVAIAVALVPPLCVTGIGIGWGDLNIIYGSFLLFLTNFFGMIVAAALTFMILGFAPIHRAKKGIIYSGIMVLIISIPLYFSFISLIHQNNDFEKLQNIKTLELLDKKVTLNIITLNNTSSDKTVIELEVITSSPLSETHYAKLKEKLKAVLQKDIILHVVPKLVIN